MQMPIPSYELWIVKDGKKTKVITSTDLNRLLALSTSWFKQNLCDYSSVKRVKEENPYGWDVV